MKCIYRETIKNILILVGMVVGCFVLASILVGTLFGFGLVPFLIISGILLVSFLVLGGYLIARIDCKV